MNKSELKKSLQELQKALDKLGKMKIAEAQKEISTYVEALNKKDRGS
jgi:hypothetical protein